MILRRTLLCPRGSAVAEELKRASEKRTKRSVIKLNTTAPGNHLYVPTPSQPSSPQNSPPSTQSTSEPSPRYPSTRWGSPWGPDAGGGFDRSPRHAGLRVREVGFLLRHALVGMLLPLSRNLSLILFRMARKQRLKPDPDRLFLPCKGREVIEQPFHNVDRISPKPFKPDMSFFEPLNLFACDFLARCWQSHQFIDPLDQSILFNVERRLSSCSGNGASRSGWSQETRIVGGKVLVQMLGLQKQQSLFKRRLVARCRRGDSREVTDLTPDLQANRGTYGHLHQVSVARRLGLLGIPRRRFDGDEKLSEIIRVDLRAPEILLGVGHASPYHHHQSLWNEARRSGKGPCIATLQHFLHHAGQKPRQLCLRLQRHLCQREPDRLTTMRRLLRPLHQVPEPFALHHDTVRVITQPQPALGKRDLQLPQILPDPFRGGKCGPEMHERQETPGILAQGVEVEELVQEAVVVIARGAGVERRVDEDPTDVFGVVVAAVGDMVGDGGKVAVDALDVFSDQRPGFVVVVDRAIAHPRVSFEHVGGVAALVGHIDAVRCSSSALERRVENLAAVMG
ncbi:hypothetical protein KC357_g119 [Hortaea werneckii]|nr:hypothetical protein KC357_g119 [Hortaea werneckii]